MSQKANSIIINIKQRLGKMNAYFQLQNNVNPLLKHKPGENSQNFHYSGLGLQPISIGQNYKYRNLIKKLTDYNRIKLSHFPSIFPSANSTLPLLASPNNPISLHPPYFLLPTDSPSFRPFSTSLRKQNWFIHGEDSPDRF